VHIKSLHIIIIIMYSHQWTEHVFSATPTPSDFWPAPRAKSRTEWAWQKTMERSGGSRSREQTESAA